MAKFFTSDLHFGDTRFGIFFRPFTSLEEQHKTIIDNWNAIVKPEDEVFVVGDVAVTDEGLEYMDQLNGRKTLITGNYDEPRDKQLLESKFEKVVSHLTLMLDGNEIYMNHYPEKAKSKKFNIVGHIHSLWKVQRNMINVSTDAWNFRPVSAQEILNCINGIKNHYDVNVFAGELAANSPSEVIFTGQPIQKNGHPTVFLAGPTPRNAETPSWRPEFIEQLFESGFKGTILTPENPKFIDLYDYDKQVSWEDEGLNKADLIVFWVPRNLKDMPGFTTNIEFGEWMKSGKVILGYPEGAEKMNYMHYKANKFGFPVVHTYDDMCSAIQEYFSGYYKKRNQA